MRIVFVSNYFNHHQKAFSETISSITGIEYDFISTMPMRRERKELGYSDENTPEYVLCAHLNDNNRILAQKLIDEADVVIAGSAPEKMLRKRVYSKKLLFRYCERPMKADLSPMEFVKLLVKENIKNIFSKRIYLLCAGAYTAGDYRKLGLFKNRTYKWGYFPETKIYDNIQDLISKKDKNTILWCGRFLEWKRPYSAITLAESLKANGYKFQLKMIGTGELEKNLKDLIKQKGLEEQVKLLGAMKPEDVRKHMEKSGIFIFTSNRQEGWGAVLNEAMNSGCAVVANNEIGSAPYLVKDNINGLIYVPENVNSLAEKVSYLLDNPCKQSILGEAAYYTIKNEWNGAVAADRFVNMAGNILNGNNEPELYSGGPLSIAK